MNPKWTFSLCATLVLLTGCGGGGESSTTPTDSSGVVTPPVVTEPPVTTPPTTTPEVTQFTISTSTNAGGSISPSSSTQNAGSQVSFTIASQPGFSIGSVSGCSGSLAGSTYTVTNLAANCTVTVQFVDGRTAPSNLNVSVQNALATVSWQGNVAATHYTVSYAEDSILQGKATANQIQQQTTTSPSWQLPLTKSYNHWYVTVKAHYGDSQLAANSEAEVTLNYQASARLNDTATQTCLDSSLKAVDCSTKGLAEQDGLVGRDAAVASLNKTGGGVAGFDFSKIGRDGSVLAVQGQRWQSQGTESAGSQWSCVRDNLTGLVWEVKTSSGPQQASTLFRWFNADASSNGGNMGSQDAGTLSCGLASCTTAAYVAYLNDIGWCGSRHWRLPTRQELSGIMLNRATSPVFDLSYFPTQPSDQLLWTSSSYAADPALAWVLSSNSGISLWQHKSTPQAVLAVHAE